MEAVPAEFTPAPCRGAVTPARLEEHLAAAVRKLREFGVGPGDLVAAVLPEGSDASTARLALAAFRYAQYVPLPPEASCARYQTRLAWLRPKLLLLHPGAHPAREAAARLDIPVANVLRHFEAGVFTLEAALAPPSADHHPAWKCNRLGAPLVLLGHGHAYRSLAPRLNSDHPVIGITPPDLAHLAPPHTLEHLAAECVRILRRFRPQGPYALAGRHAEGLIAIEMARLLEEAGERVPFVALLDASALFYSPLNLLRRAANFLRLKKRGSEKMATALRQYRPAPWFGKILHIRSSEDARQVDHVPHLEWRQIAPQGVERHETPGEMFADPGAQAVASILAGKLRHLR